MEKKDFVFVLGSYRCNKKCPYCIAKMNKKSTNDFVTEFQMLKEQLEAKDKQIESLQKLLDQEQHLNAMNHEKILLLESKLEEPKEPVEPDEEPPKGFWTRFFKK